MPRGRADWCRVMGTVGSGVLRDEAVLWSEGCQEWGPSMAGALAPRVGT